MDEDQILQSIIADPDVVDPAIDTSRLRKTTETSPRLLGGVTGIEGLKYDPTRTDYIRDLYKVYSGGLPTIDVTPVVDTTTPVVDTTTPVIDTSATDEVTGDSVLDTTPMVTIPTTDLSNQMSEVSLPVAPPNVGFDRPTIADVTAPIPLSQQDVIGTDANVGFDIETSPQVATFGDLGKIDDIVEGIDLATGLPETPNVAFDRPTIADVTAPIPLSQQDIIGTDANVGFEPKVTIDETPETFVNKTKNFLGLDNVDLPEFAIKAAINKTVGQPITFAFDLAKNIFSEQKTQDTGVTPEDAFDVTPDLADDFEVSGDVANVGTAMDLIGPAPTPQDIPDRGRGDTPGSGQISDAQAAANRDAARGQTGGGSSNGGGKIVCTMMNESYGFGSFRNKIWLRHSKNLAPEYQKGYHKIFLPLVRLSKKNFVLKKVLEHIAVHRTIDIRQESRGKVHLLGRVYRKILEPICYWVGKYDK